MGNVERMRTGDDNDETDDDDDDENDNGDDDVSYETRQKGLFYLPNTAGINTFFT